MTRAPGTPRWRSPPDSSPRADGGLVPRGRLRPAPPARLRALRRGWRRIQQRHGHVVQRAELGQQVVELVDEAQVLVAPAAWRRWHQPDSGRPIDRTRPLVGASSPPSRCSSVLCPSRGADDGHRLAGLDRQVHARSTSRPAGPSWSKRLVRHAARRAWQHGLIHSAAPRPVDAGWRASSGRAWPQRPAPATPARWARCRHAADRWACG